ncbi:hypothetical protein [Novosphingobium album (ex Hu et al. 2023)]|uniref:Uncharacterized protein n=1 Tax=Novosphingobium album (ex Hu et al. 2023) TaxID=2930093 RepID=A0ABT0B1H4_9SPHN|nr:hypothetical protein [Novosphingobium album (ex Hu et al. 2023)]MCJ2178879.1 hypothetical protein [Novosphingobium album (ex Hu et al. 2023)]
MSIGAEIPFRRRRRGRDATGSLIFDRERETQVREQAESRDGEMRIWENGRFRKA